MGGRKAPFEKGLVAIFRQMQQLAKPIKRQ